MDANGGFRQTPLFLFSLLLLLSSFIYISTASSALSEDQPEFSLPSKSHIANHKHKVYFTEKGRSVEVRLAYDTDDDEFVSVNVLDRKSNGPFHGSAAIVDPNAALLIYTPAAAFTGKDTFLCELCRTRDGNKACSQMQVTVAVRIDAADDQVSTMEGQQVEFMPLENDDILADPDTLLIVSYPLSGAIDIDSGVRVIYTPNPGFFGYDSLEYEVCEDESRDNCGRAVANITVTLLTKPDEFEVSSRVASVLNLLKNDGSQANIDARTLKISAEPKHGAIVSIESGEVTYLPQRNFAGEDSFYYTVCSQELVDSSILLKTQQTAELAFLQVNVIFEHYSEELRERAGKTAAPLDQKEDLPTSMEQIGSWFSAFDALDAMHQDQDMRTQHATLQEQLLHLKSVEVFATWLANHEFNAMRKATASNKAQISDTIGEWDIVIVEVSDGGKDVYGEMEADIEATVSRIFVEDLSYLEAGDLASAVLAQWLWDNHKEDVERVVNQHSQVVIDKRRVCSEPVKVTVIVQLWAKDDSIRVKEGSTTDVVVLANDHVLAKPSTLLLVSLPSAPGATVDVVQKSTYFVLRYSTPMGFFGQDRFEYQVCTDHTRTICGRAHVLAQVENYAVQAHNDFYQLPYNPKAHRICPLNNDRHVDRRSLSVESESAKGALLELEQDEHGANTGCVLYTAREAASGDDHFHYEVCGTGRGCVQAKVRLDVACSYFGQDPAQVDYLLMRQVNEELIAKVNETIALLKRLKTLSQGYDPRTNMELSEDFQEWNQALRAFSKEDLANMEQLQAYVLSRLLAITPYPSCGTTA